LEGVHNDMGMRKFMTAGLLVVAVSLIAGATFVQGAMGPGENIGEQWKIAMQHAKLAQNYSNTKEIQMHLQHVINCLEGKGGGAFEGATGNPCEGKGTGMMADAKTAGGKYMTNMHWMQLSDSVAMLGRKATTADMAKAAAWATEKVLEQTGSVLK
jgi:hypothetical protein